MANVVKDRAWQRNKSWSVWANEDGACTAEYVQLCVLQDIRDELRDLNRLLNCHNVTEGFKALQKINKRMGKFDALKLRKP